MKLTKEELTTIYGGAFSAALVTAIVKGFEFLYDLGRSLGTSITRAFHKKYC